MSNVNKRPQVIRDLIDLATYIAQDNLDVSDRFLNAAENTFHNWEKCREWGKSANFIIRVWPMFGSRQLKGLRDICFFADSPIPVSKLFE